MLWHDQTNEAANTVSVYPDDSSGPSGVPISGQYVYHYYKIQTTSSGQIFAQQSQWDFAIIDFSTSLSSYGSFGIYTDYSGGTVHMTGYPEESPGFYL
jgi:hypothetical protein